MKLIKTLIPTFKQSVNAHYFEPMVSGESYNASRNDVVAVNTEIYGSIINLPEGVGNQTSVTITDHSGNSSNNNIQVISTIEIEGATQEGSYWVYLINSDYETINLVKTSDKWKMDGIASGSGLPTSQGFIYINESGNPEAINNNTIGNDKGLLGFDSTGSPTVMDVDGGLKFTTSGLNTTVSADVGNGLEINSTTGKIDVKTGDGITIESGALKINLAEATGDVNGTYPNLTVNGINGQPIDINSGTLSDGQSLVWNGSLSRWINATVSGGGGGGGVGFSYYLNYNTLASSTPSGTWREMSTNPSNSPTLQTATINGVTTTPTSMVKFETPVGNPGIAILPGGNWNLNLYFSTTAPSGEAYFLFKIYKISGTTTSLIIESSNENLTSNSTTLYNTSVTVPATSFSVTDRIGIEILVGRYNSVGSYNVSGYFEGTNIGYVQTSIGTPGGTGLLKTVGGILQSPASLISNGDVDINANILGSKIQKTGLSNFGTIQLNATTGDLSETSTNSGIAKVVKIQGKPINPSSPVPNEVLIYTSSNEWSHGLISDSNVSTITGSKVSPNFGSQNIVTTGSINGGTITGTNLVGPLKPSLSAGVIHSTGTSNALTSSLILDADVDPAAAITGTKIKKSGTSQFGVIKLSTSGSGTSGDLSEISADSGIAKVVKIQGVNVSATPPNSGNILKYVGTSWTPSSPEPYTTLIYDPLISADDGNIYKTWNNLIANIPRFSSGNLSEVKGNILIILRDDITLTASLNLSGRVKIKGEFKKNISSTATVGRFPIIYTSTFYLQDPSEFENINITNNNPNITSESVTPEYCFKFQLPSGMIPFDYRQFHKLILKNTQLYSLPVGSLPVTFNRRFIEITRYHRINIELYGRSVIGGNNPDTWNWG